LKEIGYGESPAGVESLERLLEKSLGDDDPKKGFLKARWLDQIKWLDGKADGAQWRYYGLRLTTIVGGVLAPALFAASTSGGTSAGAGRFHVAAVIVSLVVGASAAIEEFFHFGDRWRNYRLTAELLKREGWMLLELAGPYHHHNYADHAAAFPQFTERVESLLSHDLTVFLGRIAREPETHTGSSTS